MTLLEIIPYFRVSGQIDAYLKSMGIDNEEGDVSVYMKDRLELASELQFLNDDQTQGRRVVDFNNSKYEELLPVYMIQEMVDELKDEYSDHQIAERILSYAINDA
jgi:hypothetical protein